MTTHRPDRWGTVCTADGKPWPCPDVAALIANGGMAWHVQPSTTGQPAEFFHRAEPNQCPVCGAEALAGYVRCLRLECRPAKGVNPPN